MVEDRNNKKRMCVRARAAVDLDNFRERYCPRLGATKTSEKLGSDYKARAFVGKRAFANAIRRAAKDIDYTNFKSRVMTTQGWDRESIYMKVWGLLKDAQSSGKFDLVGTGAPQSFYSWEGFSPANFRPHFADSFTEPRGQRVFRHRSFLEPLDEDDPEGPSDLKPYGLPEGTHRNFSTTDERDPFFWEDGDRYTPLFPEDPVEDLPEVVDPEETEAEIQLEVEEVRASALFSDKRVQGRRRRGKHRGSGRER